MCEIATAQVYSYATSKIHCNYQNLLVKFFKNILPKYDYKEKYKYKN